MYVSTGFLKAKWGIFKKSSIASLSPLTHLDAAQLNEYLEKDGRQVAYSAVVSIADAIRGIEAGFHSWAAIKLYYSLFFCLRAFLCFNGKALFFSDGKPFRVDAAAGAYPQTVSTSSSHKAVMQIFGANFNGSLLLSQTIGLLEPFEWMQLQRETVNYRQAKFAEPNHLSVFKGILQARSIRKVVTVYITDQTLAFDENHAILAYPILALSELKKSKPDLFEDEDQERLLALLSDNLGRINAFEQIIH